jgi:hypothetical protein
MYWFWLNISLATTLFAAWAGIPLWLVARHLNNGPRTASADRREHASDGRPRIPDQMLVR